jgi:hypothetical protein
VQPLGPLRDQDHSSAQIRQRASFVNKFLLGIAAVVALVGLFSLTSVFVQGGSPSPSPSPSTSARSPEPSRSLLQAPALTLAPAESYGLSTDLVVCASDLVEALVLDASQGGGIFSPGTAPLRGLSAVWRWEMPAVGELVVVAVDTEGIDPSGRTLLGAPGAVDALGDAGGVLDRSAAATSGRWWVGVGTAFSVAVPLTFDQVTAASEQVARCLNGETQPSVE